MEYIKTTKRALLILLAISMITSLFAGCASGSGKNTTSTTAASTTTAVSATTPANTVETTAEDPLKEPMEISMAIWNAELALPENTNDAVRDAFYKKLNITIKPVNLTWEDYMQKIQIWAASSQLPDCFSIDAVTTTNFKNWIDQGIVKKLPDDMSNYPELNKILSAPEFSMYKYPLGSADGKYYCIPRLNYRDANWWANDYGVLVRKDWMQNLNISEPQNMDEFINLMKAFAEKDPDKNGKNDTIGLTTYSADWLGWLMNSYQPAMTGTGGTATGAIWVRDAENPGKWIPAFMTKDALEGFKAIKSLHDAGGLDKDFATIKGNEGIDKFSTGKAGAIAWGGNYGSISAIYKYFSKMYPDAKIADTLMLLHPFKNYKDGNYYRYIANPGWSETYINAKCDDKKVDRILRLYDFALSREGYNLLHFGIENTDWKYEGDNIILIPHVDSDGKVMTVQKRYPFTYIAYLEEWSGAGAYTNPSPYPQLTKMSKDMLDWWLANSKPMDADLRMGFIDYPSKDKNTDKFAVDLARLILSKDIDKEYNTMISEYMTSGYDKVISEVNAKASELGIK